MNYLSPRASAGNEKQDRKIRVLLCNVFFPPQTYGGATRVVRDNVDYLIDNEPNIELFVLTTDEGVDPPGRVRFDSYRGVPVVRLSCQNREEMDWRAFEHTYFPLYETLLDAIKPDLIHAHCMQRLTATLLEAARHLSIPFAVTLHDAWWLSEHQFLVDPEGIYQPPSNSYFEAASVRGTSQIDSVIRRAKLADILRSAHSLLAVSGSFAQLYRDCGFQNVTVIENGVSELAGIDRPKRSRDIVSLGHIGGRNAHKGAVLLEAALRGERFENLRLTMIDGRRPPGDDAETCWGATPVVLRSQVPQGDIHRLYAELDVLIAPSIWPESYGLVTREALELGCWVIASDRGAIGDPIEEGVNGYRIDVSSTDALRNVLRMMDQQPERFTNSPPPGAHERRHTAEQGRELASLYRRAVVGSSSE